MTVERRAATAEHERLEQKRNGTADWLAWGPYLSERQWGTVREDYSADGDAWDYFPHDQARSRAYRWGEDGIAGISDDAPASVLRARVVERRRRDPQGAAVRPHQRRGEPRRGRQGVLVLPRQHADALVHEVLYKYPQREFPYNDLVETNRAAAATNSSTSCSIRASSTRTATSTCSSSTPRQRPMTSSSQVTAHNRGPEPRGSACAADAVVSQHVAGRPRRSAALRAAPTATVRAPPIPSSGVALCTATGPPSCCSCENETNNERLFGAANVAAYVKDGINDYVVDGATDAVNPAQRGRRWRRNTGSRSSPVRAPESACVCVGLGRSDVRRSRSAPALTRFGARRRGRRVLPR